MADEFANAPAPTPSPEPVPPPRRRLWLNRAAAVDFALLVTLLFVGVYEALVATRLDRTVAMFVGVPLALGMLCASVRPQHAVARTLKYVTLCLCIVAPLLGEGAVCLVMAAPIVYPVAALAAWGFSKDRSPKLRAVVALPFLVALLQKKPIDELPRVTAEASAVVDAAPATVWRAIQRFELPLDRTPPLFLRLGFPRPRVLLGAGLAVGAERRVVFDNGTVVARVVDVVPGRRFTMRLSYEDVGHEFFDRWLWLEDATIALDPLPGGRTRITHQVHYRRLLAPEFYFGPLERYGVHQMQEYLIDVFRTSLPARAAVADGRG